jgi:hypothetical protein
MMLFLYALIKGRHMTFFVWFGICRIQFLIPLVSISNNSKMEEFFFMQLVGLGRKDYKIMYKCAIFAVV